MQKNLKKRKIENIASTTTKNKKQKSITYNERRISQLIQRNADIVDFNTLISQFASHKQLGLALKAWDALKKTKLEPTVYTFSALMNACVRCGEVQKAQDIHDEMISMGILPNEVCFC
jgi:pentatricopeptide repeat protein